MDFLMCMSYALNCKLVRIIFVIQLFYRLKIFPHAELEMGYGHDQYDEGQAHLKQVIDSKMLVTSLKTSIWSVCFLLRQTLRRASVQHLSQHFAL